MPYFKKLVGEKIYLSPVSTDDAVKFTRWVNDLETTYTLQLAPQIISLDREQEFLERMQKEGYNFAIVNKENDELLGSCGLLQPDLVQRTSELGIFIGEKKQRGKGAAA